ncbi:MAG: hypothetical protein VCD66_17210 [Alphaproteobacteria bacterium]|jgi:hypothetical protein
MTRDRETVFSAAFDGMLEQNRQRLDELYGGPADRPSPTTSLAPKAPPTTKGRWAGRVEGREFSFEIQSSHDN